MNRRMMLNIFMAISASVVLMIAGCGGSGSSADSGGGDETGDLVISLTDAPGDFADYTVDVLSLNLIRADGTKVSALPLETRIDFSQYTEMTEFLTAATIPGGTYVEATLTLDYSNADIRVEDESGNAVRVETILDEQGNPVTTVAMTVRLEGRNALTIAAGGPAHLLLDFNLEASNQVTFNGAGVPTVAVEPFLAADVNRTDNKLHRLRGLLDSVSVDEGSFSVYLRPFCSALTGDHDNYGIHTVMTSDTTAFNIDGTSYIGQAGLSALADLPAFSAVVVVGDLAFDPLRFEAQEVYAGTSVPGGSLDAVQGSVLSRTGDTLTIKGATLIRRDGTVTFNDRVTVEIGADTAVSRQFSIDTFGKDDISVGQRVIIGGIVTDTDPLSLTMDATGGYARLLLTTVRGTVNGIDEENATAQLALSLQCINHHRADIFDFSGTGIDAENDADPDNYEINTGALTLPPMDLDAPVKVRGFVQAFGQAPADFNAQTIIDVTDARAFMKVKWTPPSDAAFESITADALVLNLESSGKIHHVFRGWVASDLTDSGQFPMVAGPEDGAGVYTIRYQGMVQVSLSFENFINNLQGHLADGAGVSALSAIGEFDDAAVVLTADVIDIQLI